MLDEQGVWGDLTGQAFTVVARHNRDVSNDFADELVVELLVRRHAASVTVQRPTAKLKAKVDAAAARHGVTARISALLGPMPNTGESASFRAQIALIRLNGRRKRLLDRRGSQIAAVLALATVALGLVYVFTSSWLLLVCLAVGLLAGAYIGERLNARRRPHGWHDDDDYGDDEDWSD